MAGPTIHHAGFAAVQRPTMLELRGRQKIAPALVTRIDHLFTFVSRVILLHVGMRRVPRLVWIEGVDVEKEWLTPMIFLQPLGGIAQCSSAKIIFFNFPVADVA